MAIREHQAPLNPNRRKIPVNSLLAGNFELSETGSLETASSSGESRANRFTESLDAIRPALPDVARLPDRAGLDRR
jgi:hypothetical protein